MSKKQKNLATTNKTDFTILVSGEAFISRNKTATLCGVTQSAISQRLISLYPNLESNQQLTADLLQQLITYYAFDAGRYCTKEAQQIAKALMTAGAKAYIYHQAGYQFDAKPRQELLKNKRLAQWTWSDSLKFQRESLGKKTSNFHYSNENLMINQVVLGERRAFTESEMSNAQVELVEKARTLNGSLIDCCMTFQERKIKLQEWFSNQPV